VDQQQMALKADPASRTYRQGPRNHCFWLANVLVVLKEHQQASKAAADMADLADLPGDYPSAAWMLAECVALAEGDVRLPVEKRTESAQAYGRQAVELLRRGAGQGGVDAGGLRADKRFAPLRSRADFNELLRDPDGKAKPGAR
jgi:hypothetical protein